MFKWNHQDNSSKHIFDKFGQRQLARPFNCVSLPHKTNPYNTFNSFDLKKKILGVNDVTSREQVKINNKKFLFIK